jgi:hypothetical protein
MLPWTGEKVPLVETKTKDEAKNWTVFLASTREAKRNRRCFIPGAYYRNLFPGYATVDATANDYDLTLNLKDGSTTTVYIRNAARNAVLCSSAVALGNRVTEVGVKGGNARKAKTTNDYGEMHVMGYKNLETLEEYAGTEKYLDVLPDFLNAAGAEMERTVPHIRADIELAETLKLGRRPWHPAFKTTDKSYRSANTVNVSVSIGNSSHFDLDDSLSWSIFVSWSGRSVKNWSFVLPHASIGNSDGVVIPFAHGVCVGWNGRVLKHCSAIPKVDEGEDVYGCFIGSIGKGCISREGQANM